MKRRLIALCGHDFNGLGLKFDVHANGPKLTFVSP
jgi:hypothetical protein